MKFVFHGWELHAVRSFGLPWPWVLEIVAGVIETIGGVLLVLRRAIAANSAVLAVTMIIAITASGIGHGDVIPSLTLAPALPITTIYLLLTAIGPRAIDRRRSAGTLPDDRWGVTPAEITRRYPCDDLIPEPVLQEWRSVTVQASAEGVWPWMAQIRLAPYSYDWIDNLGRRSPQTLRSQPEPVVGEAFTAAIRRTSYRPDRCDRVGQAPHRPGPRRFDSATQLVWHQ